MAAINLGSIVLKLLATNKEYLRVLDQSDAAAKKAAGEISASFLAAGVSLSAFSAALSKGLIEATQYAARTEVTSEVLHLIAENAGESAKQIDQLRDRIKDLGITTQVSNQALIRMMQYELDLSQATQLAAVAQDAAVVAGENSSVTLDKLIYGITTLNTRLLRNRGIMINLNHEYARYAEQEEKIVGELTVHDRHQATLNAVLREGAKLTGAYERAMEFAGKRVTSLARLQEEFNNALGQYFIPIMGGVVNAIWKVLEGYTRLSPATQKMIAFTIAAATAITGLAGAFLIAKAAMIKFGISLAAVMATAGPWILAIAGVSLAIGAFITVVQEKERAIVAAQEKAIALTASYEQYARRLEREAIPSTRRLEEALYDLVKAEEMALEQAEEMQRALLAWAEAQAIVEMGYKNFAPYIGAAAHELDEQMKLLVISDPLLRELAYNMGLITKEERDLAAGLYDADRAMLQLTRRTDEHKAALGRATHTLGVYLKDLNLLIERVPWLKDKVFELSFALDHELGIVASKAWYKLRDAAIEVTQEQMDMLEELGFATEKYVVIVEDAGLAAVAAYEKENEARKELLGRLAEQQEEYNNILLGARDERQTLADEEAIAIAELQIGLQEELATSLQSYEEERGKIVAWGTNQVTGEISQGAIDRLAILDKNYADQDAALKNFWGVKIGHTQSLYAIERRQLREQIKAKIVLWILEQDTRMKLEGVSAAERYRFVMETLKMTITTYKDKLNKFLNDMMRALMEAGLPENLAEAKIRKVIASLEGATDAALVEIDGLTEGAREAIGGVWDEFGAGQDVVDDLTDGIDDMGRAARKGASSTKKMADPLKTAAGTVSSLASMVQKASKAFAELAQYAVPLPEFELGWQRLREQIEMVVIDMGAMVARLAEMGFDKEKYEGVKQFADAVRSAFSVISSAVKAFTDMADWEAGERIAEKVHAIAARIVTVIRQLGMMARTLPEEMAVDAKLFAERAGAVISVFKAAIDMLTPLQEWERGPRIGALAHAIAARLVTIARELGLMSRTIPDQVVDDAKAFTERVGNIVGFVKSALDTLIKLGEWDPGDRIAAQAHALAARIVTTVRQLGLMARTLPEDMLEDAKLFAERVGKIIDIIKPAVEGLASLEEWMPGARIKEQAHALAARIVTIVREIGKMARTIDQRMVDDAKAFAESIGGIIDFVSKGMKLLTEMKAWKLVDDVTEQMAAFRKAWKQIIEEFNALRKDVEYLLDEDVRKFAQTMEAIADALDKALKVLTGIADFVVPADAALDDFMGAVQDMFLKMYDWIAGRGEWEGKGANLEDAVLEIITAFGDALGSLMQGLTTAAEFALVDWVAPDPALWGPFFAWVTLVFGKFYEWLEGEEWTTEQVGLVGAFADALSSLMQGLTAAVEFELGAGWAKPPQEAWDRLIEWVQEVFEDFYDWLEGDYAADEVALVGTFADALASLMEGLGAAAEFALAEDWAPPSANVWFKFYAWVKLLFSKVYGWLKGEGWTETLTALVGAFGDALSSLVQGLQAAADFALAEDWAPPTAKAWFKFYAWIKLLFSKVYGWLASNEWTETQVGLVGAFGDALSSLVQGLQAAAEFALSKEWAEPDPDIWAPFFTWVTDLFDTVYQWVTEEHVTDDGQHVYTKDGLDLVNAWGSALGSIMSALSGAITLATEVADFVDPGKAWDDFILWANGVFDELYTHITTTYPQTEEEASQFAPVQAWGEAMTAVFGGLSSAMGIFRELGYYATPLEKYIDAFIEDVQDIFNRFYEWLTGTGEYKGIGANFSEEGLLITQSFGDTLSALMGGLNEAVLVLSGVGGLFHPTKEKLNFFMGQVELVFGRMHIFAQGLDPKEVAITDTFSGVMNNLVTAMSAALGLIGKIVDTPLPEFEGKTAPLWFEDKVGNFIEAIHFIIISMQNWVVTDLGPEVVLTVQWFTDVLSNMVGGLSSALGFLAQLTDTELPSAETLQTYLDLILQLYQELAAGLEGIPSKVLTAGQETSATLEQATANLPNAQTWYEKGASYAGALAKGINAGVPALKASLEVASGLLPASPAKWGPFADLPTAIWVDDYMADVAGAFDRGIAGLGSLPGVGLPPAWAGDAAGGDMGKANAYITINMPDAVIRSDEDIRLLAQEIWHEVRRTRGVG